MKANDENIKSQSGTAEAKSSIFTDEEFEEFEEYVMELMQRLKKAAENDTPEMQALAARTELTAKLLINERNRLKKEAGQSTQDT